MGVQASTGVGIGKYWGGYRQVQGWVKASTGTGIGKYRGGTGAGTNNYMQVQKGSGKYRGE